MTKEEYIQLVQSSEAFKRMDQETQNKILTAEGADMEAYAKIFMNEQNRILTAKKDFVTTTVQIIDQFEKDAKVIVTVERKKEEEEEKKVSEDESEKLLSEINNL